MAITAVRQTANYVPVYTKGVSGAKGLFDTIAHALDWHKYFVPTQSRQLGSLRNVSKDLKDGLFIAELPGKVTECVEKVASLRRKENRSDVYTVGNVVSKVAGLGSTICKGVDFTFKKAILPLSAKNVTKAGLCKQAFDFVTSGWGIFDETNNLADVRRASSDPHMAKKQTTLSWVRLAQAISFFTLGVMVVAGMPFVAILSASTLGLVFTLGGDFYKNVARVLDRPERHPHIV